MKGSVSVGSEVSYELHSALLIYKRSAHHGSDDVFITRHEVKKDEGGVPVLGPGQTLTMEFVSDLMRAFQGKLDTQVLPENVLVHSFERIVWWVPPAIRAMFYAVERSPELEKLSGKRYPQPALLFDVMGGNLQIRALGSSARPNADTPLFRAPYWNVSDTGLVCLGEDALPSCSAAEALDRQEPFINNVLASSALAMLTRLLHYGQISLHGALFNAESGHSVPLPIDPEAWTKQRRRQTRGAKAA